MKRHLIHRAICALPALLATSALAQTNSTVTVTGAAEPAAAEKVDPARLRAGTSDTASMLRDVPGVSLYGAGGVSSLPAIHGLADDRLRIKIDGMDLIASCPNHMNPALSYLDPAQVTQLSVHAGLAPVSVGGDSIGGSIVAESAPPTFVAPGEASRTGGEIGLTWRDNGDALRGHVALRHSTASFALTYTGARAESENPEAGGAFKTVAATGRAGHQLPLDEIGSSAYRSENHALSLAWRNAAHLFEARLGLQDLPYQNYPNQRMDMLDNQQERIALRYRGAMSWGTLEARAYHESVEHLMDFGADKRFWYGSASGGPTASAGNPCSPIGTTCATGMPMRTAGKTLGATAQASVDLAGGSMLRLGAEMQRYDLDDWWPPSGSGMWPLTFWNIRDGQRDRDALFAEWDGKLDSSWRATAGLRAERVTSDAGAVRGYDPNTNGMGMMVSNQKRDADAFNARDRRRSDGNVDVSAVVRQATATRDIEFGIARKTRSPNLYERYTWSTWSMAAVMNNFVGDGNGYIGNLDLEPEVAHTLGASVEWHAADRAWSVKLAPWITSVSDFIDARRCTSGASCTAGNTTTATQFVVLQYVNADARLHGIDLSGHLPLAKNAWGDWQLGGTLSWIDGENRDTGDGLYNIMPLHLRLTLGHKLGAWDNRMEVVAVDAKTDVSHVRNEIRTAGHAIANLRLAYATPRWRLDFGFENLFDKAYDLPLGGAYVGQGTTMSINAVPWGIAVPGPGRTIYAGGTLMF